MNVFARQKSSTSMRQAGFEYLDGKFGYFDSACQTLRPQPVIDALERYYHEYNACGGRVKYAWGKRVDTEVAEARETVLKLLGKSSKKYICAFTLNTTYGLNLILSQLQSGGFKKVLTSEIEHNSAFLPTMTLANRLDVKRQVLARGSDGSLEYVSQDLEQAIVVVNATSNIDGRVLINGAQLCDDTHQAGGLVVLDGAQTMGHDFTLLKKTDFDALCFSSHKMYGPSLGVIVAKKSLIEKLDIGFVGGGMVEDVLQDSYRLATNDWPSRFEAGLQDFGGIIAFSAALEWRRKWRSQDQKSATEYEQELAARLYEGIQSIEGLSMINQGPSPVISFSSDKVDAHRIATLLSQHNFMARSGYFCCHYYLIHKRQLPPQLRLSLGLNNTAPQIDRLLELLRTMQRNS